MSDNIDPEIYSETSDKYTPQELGYDKNGRIDFKKGCFTGQEIIARMHYRSPGIFSIARVEIDDTNKSFNEVFTVNDKKVGNILDYANGKYLVSGKTKNFDYLYEEFSKFEEFELTVWDDKSDPSWFGFPVSVKDNVKFDRNELLKHYDKNNIGTSIVL